MRKNALPAILTILIAATVFGEVGSGPSLALAAPAVDGREPLPVVSLSGVRSLTLSAAKLDRWSALRARHRAQVNSREWQTLIGQLRSRSQIKLLDRVNQAVNRVRYVSDGGDVWQTPTEFLRKGGDCEDYALAKYLVLRQLGVPPSRMRVLALAARPGIQSHSVLVVETPKGQVVLDNQRADAYSLGSGVTSRIVYGFNDTNWWVSLGSGRALANAP
jgi:predicted transglutaminase-like cysteine proteinase